MLRTSILLIPISSKTLFKQLIDANNNNHPVDTISQHLLLRNKKVICSGVCVAAIIVLLLVVGCCYKMFNRLFAIQTHAHVARFLVLKHDKSGLVNNNIVQVVTDGSSLTVDNIYSGFLSIHDPIIVTDSPQSIGMVVDVFDGSEKQSTKKNNSSDKMDAIFNNVDHSVVVKAIDVESQREMDNVFTFGTLYSYFTNKQRLAFVGAWEKHLRDIEHNLECSDDPAALFSSSACKKK